MRRISILNFKGGTGKSSVAQNLGDALVRAGKEVLIIDGDRQSNTTTTLLGQRVTPSLTDVFMTKAKLTDAIFEARPRFYVVPSDTNLDKAIGYIRDHPAAFFKVREALLKLEGQGIDFVFVDQAGAYSMVMAALLVSCSEMLIPCELEPYAVAGLGDMFSKLRNEEVLEEHQLTNAGIIPYNLDQRREMTSVYLAELRATFGDLITVPVRTDTMVSYAQSKKKTIFEYQEEMKVKSRAAEDFTNLAQRFLAAEKVQV